MFQHHFSSKLKNKVGVSVLYMCAYIMRVYTSVSGRGREKGRRQMCLNTSSLLTETINKTTLYVSWWPGGSQDAQWVLRDWGQGRVMLWAPLCAHNPGVSVLYHPGTQWTSHKRKCLCSVSEKSFKLCIFSVFSKNDKGVFIFYKE